MMLVEVIPGLRLIESWLGSSTKNFLQTEYLSLAPGLQQVVFHD